MSLERKQFAEFFVAAHGLAPSDPDDPDQQRTKPGPFDWQERLLDQVLETGVWPDRIVAPTGAGKTAAIDVHVFATALTASTGGPRLPRRLAMVVGRRVLVDDQFEHARHLADLLANPPEGAVSEVADALARLRRPAGQPGTKAGDGSLVPADADGASSPLVVARLRGGAVPSREWRDHPTACAVLCATPDMFGSRLLFRGYGTTRLARPREAGLLAFDTVVIVDEAHLSQQLLTTTRRVAKLATVAESPLPVPCLQVVETTATPAEPGNAPDAGAVSVGVTDDDLNDPALAARLTRPKPVRLLRVKDWPPASPAQQRKVAKALADAVAEMLDHSGDVAGTVHTVGCFVNTVGMAIAVGDELRGRRRADAAEPWGVVTVCGQVRPADLERLRDEHLGVLSIAGNGAVDVLVGTQSLEVGVDLDLAGIVTELAPGSALAQRAGRVNRRGLRASAPVVVVTGDGEINERAQSGPYRAEDLRRGLDWVTGREQDPNGMAPWALRAQPPPSAARRRILFQRPELADAWHWARTSEELAARPELDLWLVDSFDEQSTVGVVVRDALPADAAEAVVLLRLLPPKDREVFTAPYRTVVAVLTALARAGQHDADKHDAGEPPPVIRVRGDEVAVLVGSVNDAGQHRFDVRPGDLVVLDSSTRAFTPSTSGTGTGFSPPVLVRSDTGSGTGQDSGAGTGRGGGPGDALDGEEGWSVPREAAADVSQTLREPRAGQVVLRLEPAAWGGHDTAVGKLVRQLVVDFATDLDVASVTMTSRWRGLAELLKKFHQRLGDHLGRTMVEAAATLLRDRPVKHSDVELRRDEAGEPVRLLVTDRRRAGADERLRQTWTVRDGPVTLEGHQSAVASRAALLGAQLGLPDSLAHALDLAGAYHDDGKADSRFQILLGAPGDAVLAKSAGTLTAAESRRLVRDSGLPGGWRHEQRSVVQCWDTVHAATDSDHARLAVRLVGTSHGHGRAGFPHTAAELLRLNDPAELRERAENLFDLGAWDELIEHTHRRWGVWGCAYLEAVLRAADGQVSAEGK